MQIWQLLIYYFDYFHSIKSICEHFARNFTSIVLNFTWYVPLSMCVYVWICRQLVLPIYRVNFTNEYLKRMAMTQTKYYLLFLHCFCYQSSIKFNLINGVFFLLSVFDHTGVVRINSNLTTIYDGPWCENPIASVKEPQPNKQQQNKNWKRKSEIISASSKILKQKQSD